MRVDSTSASQRKLWLKRNHTNSKNIIHNNISTYLQHNNSDVFTTLDFVAAVVVVVLRKWSQTDNFFHMVSIIPEPTPSEFTVDMK